MSGSRETPIAFPNRRHTLRARPVMFVSRCTTALVLFAALVSGQPAAGPTRVTLDQAIELALAHNHTLRAIRTNIQQNLAQEITANVRPNPTIFTDWQYLPLYNPEGGF